jgi:CheY-like chemotaxis protein
MDLQMPVMDGITATARIRALPGREHTRILAVTAHALAEERHRCVEAGMDGHIAKPFRPHELFAALEAVPAHPVQRRGTRTMPPSHDAPPPEAALHNDVLHAARAEPALDVEAFRATLCEAGVEAAMEAMLDTFMIDYPGRIVAIVAACDAADATAVRAATHALRSAAGAIGAGPLSRLLHEAETRAHEGRIHEAVALRTDILAAGDAVMAILAARRSAASV